ncbi:hypothetical protein ACHAXT_009113 [Thalassiosira profunda]
MKFAALSTAAALQAAWLLPSVSAADVNIVPFIEDVHQVTESFRKRDCNVVELSLGNDICEMPTDFQGVKTRRLLKFSTGVWNIGTDDLQVNRQDSPDNFEWGDCHKHWHFKEFTYYELINSVTGEIITGRKQAFCLMDIRRMDPSAGGATYGCGNQGISAGWADIYSYNLDGQHIDITGVPAGTYELRVTINAGGAIAETDHTDNTVTYESLITLGGTNCDASPSPSPPATPPPDTPGPAPACNILGAGCESAGECCSQVCVHQSSGEKKHVDDTRFLRAIGAGSGNRKLNTCTDGGGVDKCTGLCECKERNDPCTANVQCCSNNCKRNTCKGS